MQNYLITGIAGTGKSTVGGALATRGYKILETDRVPDNSTNYRVQFDARTNEPSTYKRGDGWDELQHVRWNIKRDLLLRELNKGAGLQFVCGYANNWDEFKEDFDGIFLLVASPSTTKDRLLHRTTGDWGKKHPEELKHALETAAEFNRSILGLGAVAIDAEQPIDSVVKNILETVEVASPRIRSTRQSSSTASVNTSASIALPSGSRSRSAV